MEVSEDFLFLQLAATCAESRLAFDREVGVSQARRHLLVMVSREGEQSLAALRRRLALDGATVTRLVKQLEIDGLLRRRLDPKDNRFTLASLTDRGERFVSDLDRAHRLFQARLLEGVSDEEQASTARLLAKVRFNIRRAQAEGRESDADAVSQ